MLYGMANLYVCTTKNFCAVLNFTENFALLLCTTGWW